MKCPKCNGDTICVDTAERLYECLECDNIFTAKRPAVVDAKEGMWASR